MSSERGTRHTYDLAIVGSGGGAFAAAIAARRRSLRVVMIEHATIGGTCVNVGCIPSKALLAAAESRHHAGDARFTGIRTSAGPVDFGALIAAKDEIVDGLRQRKYLDIAADYGIDVLDGHARFVDGLTLDVDGRRIDAAHYLIATGAEAHIPDDVPGLAGSGYLTSTTAMALDDLPESMIVIGGGYVAMEQAQLFSQLGTRVTILVRSSLARREEPELAHGIREAFTDQGIAVFEGVQPTVVRRDGDITVVAGDREFRAAQLLVATGRAPRTADLGLQAVGVETGGRGEVVVGDDLRTTNPRVWAAGDVTGHPQFVYVAARHGALVVDNAFGRAARRVDYDALPRITFTSPTLASAGLTEAHAVERGVRCESRVLGLEHVPRAIVSRDTRGLVKLVAEHDSGRVVGVHLLADGAGDAILAGVYAIEGAMTVAQLASSWNPYLTIGEAIWLAAQSFTRDPGTLSCCAT